MENWKPEASARRTPVCADAVKTILPTAESELAAFSTSRPRYTANFSASTSSISMSGTPPSNESACFASSLGICPVRCANRPPLSGEYVKDAVAAVIEVDREPCRGFGFLLRQRLRIAQELLDLLLVARLRLEGEKQSLCVKFGDCSRGKFVGQHVELLDSGRMREQRIGLHYQRRRDRARQVRIAAGVIREDIEDAILREAEPDGEPCDCGRFLRTACTYDLLTCRGEMSLPG
jgi:hypothetical protein